MEGLKDARNIQKLIYARHLSRKREMELLEKPGK